MADNKERREVAFQSLDEVVAEAERLAAGEVRVVGNHTFAEILNHLAISQNAATGRVTPPPPPFFMKLMRPLIKPMVFNSKPLKPGIKLPASGESFFWPDKQIETAAALANLKESTDYYNANGPLPKHPFFGTVSRSESDSFNCRHAALHLSFVHPA